MRTNMQTMSIIGFVGRDPEERVSSTGNKGIFFSVAVDNFSKGEKKTIWYKIQVWDSHLFKMAQAIHKGSLVSIAGSLLEPQIYQAKDGENKINLSIKANALWFIPTPKKDKEKQDEQDLFVDL